MPFAFLTVPIGYAYHEAFEGSFSKVLNYLNRYIGGYLFAFFILGSGILAGGVAAFYISKLIISQVCGEYRSFHAARLY
jgi:hypothetical protein